MIAFVDDLDAPLPQGIAISISSGGYFLATFTTNAQGAIPLVPTLGQIYQANFSGYRAPTTTLVFTGANDPQTVLIAGFTLPPAYVPRPSIATLAASPQPNPAATRTDIALVYGGKIQFAPNGDLAIVQDVPGNPACTAQHVQHDIQLSPRARDSNNQPVSRPDDLFHPDRGAGAPSFVGQPNSAATESKLISQATRTLKMLDGLAASPAPVIAVTSIARDAIELDISATTATGDPLAVPGIELTFPTTGA